MKRAVVFWSVMVLSLCGVLALASERPTAPVIEAVRLGEHRSGHTRIVLDMDASPSFTVTPQRLGQEPVLELSVARASFNLDGPPAPTGVVSGLSLGEGAIRMTLRGEALPVRSFVMEPTDSVAYYRLVIDVEPVERLVFAEAVEKAEADSRASAEGTVSGTAAVARPGDIPASTPASLKDKDGGAIIVTDTRPGTAAAVPKKNDRAAVAASSVPRVPSIKPRRAPRPAPRKPSGALTIVIDPGHGGRDPGAVGKSGLTEKAVNLGVAEVLKAELEERGYDVVLTREGDTFIDVPDRIMLARDRQADMFLSLHADANPSLKARGASVYTLSEDRSRKMVREAADEGDFRVFDRELGGADSDVTTILFDLANEDTKTHSARLATALIQEMTGRVRMVNNTHRKAGLMVLLSPDVPAVLIELAFISNPIDEANLRSTRWRRTAALAIADGVDRYFGTTGRRVGQAPAVSAAN